MFRAFIDYYREHDISPVGQDISDLRRHFERRASLYRYLGIAPRYVRAATVLEFGPGSGHNALYTAALGPAHYTLVDANPRGLRETSALLAKVDVLPRERYTLVESLVEDYRSDDLYDLVLAEGMLPFQMDPAGLARRMASFTAEGGIYVVTCVDTASLFAETGRRLLADRLAPPTLPIAERVERLRPFLAPHLATLAGFGRTVDDWILDNVTQPLPGKVFSFAEAVAALGADFDVFGSSPRIETDLRWYKDVHGAARRFNEAFTLRYRSNIVNLLDYRVEVAPHDPAVGDAILGTADRLYAAMQAHERGEPDCIAGAAQCVDEAVAIVAPISTRTAASLRALAAALRASSDDIVAAATPFADHFGRGQQYASFVRKSHDMTVTVEIP